MLVYLEITSWIGLSPGAIHYYGKLKTSYREKFDPIELTKKLTKYAAQKLSKLDDFTYQEGDEISRFESKDEITKLGIQSYQLLFSGATGLILGRSSCADPQQILHGLTNVAKEANLLYEQAVKIDWYENDEVKMDQIANQWMELIKA